MFRQLDYGHCFIFLFFPTEHSRETNFKYFSCLDIIHVKTLFMLKHYNEYLVKKPVIRPKFKVSDHR